MGGQVDPMIRTFVHNACCYMGTFYVEPYGRGRESVPGRGEEDSLCPHDTSDSSWLLSAKELGADRAVKAMMHTAAMHTPATAAAIRCLEADLAPAPPLTACTSKV